MAEEILNKRLVDASDAAKECEAVEADIAALKVAYEQYFLGVDRMPPSKQHADLKKRIQQLKSGFVRQTSTKFRIQAVQAKFVSYERLWTRTLQEVENGTYRRDLFKAKLRSKPPEPPKPAASAAAQGAPVAPGKPEAPAQPAVAAKAGAGAPPRPGAQPPPAPSAAALSDQKLRAVYDAYVTAKKRCAEDVSKLTFESVASNLRKQVPELLKKHNASGVEFKVVIKDGKAILRALPKE